ncbi:MAG TPA: helix-turn-helix domain-containing protein, partial [Rhodopila sp.]|nr:helix-turn-helix domain-containing protein [Rhodopila sp.]
MSTITPPMASGQHAPLAGADLREARERLGWSLEDVAFGLRIRYVYLEALEAGRLSALPSPAYAFAFIRTYARTLGLDPDEIARRFKAEAGEAAKPADLTFPVPIPER